MSKKEIVLNVVEKEINYIQKEYKIPEEYESEFINIVDKFKDSQSNLSHHIGEFILHKNIQPSHQEIIDSDETTIEYVQKIELTNIKDDQNTTILFDIYDEGDE